YELCGKVIVATSQEELPQLETIYERGIQNGLTNLKKLRKEELHDYEPHVNGIAGIHVPQTGIINYKVVAEKYAEKLVQGGAEIRLGTKVTHIIPQRTHTEVITPLQAFNC